MENVINSDEPISHTKKYENMFKDLDLHEITEKQKNIFKKSKDQKISLKIRLSYYLSTKGRCLIG